VSDTELPPGWTAAPLGTLWTQAQPGFASSARANDGVLQLRLNNITTAGEFDWSQTIRVPADDAVREKYDLQPGDILFNNTNSAELVGKSALVNDLPEPAVFSNHFTRLRFRNGIEPRYVTFWLRSLWQRKVFEYGCDRWVGQAGFQNRKLKELQLPLPPTKAEQRKIADKLEKALAEITSARVLLERQLEDVRRALPSSLLGAAFRGEL
jgi:type I restriction enzyme, S subunit